MIIFISISMWAESAHIPIVLSKVPESTNQTMPINWLSFTPLVGSKNVVCQRFATKIQPQAGIGSGAQKKRGLAPIKPRVTLVEPWIWGLFSVSVFHIHKHHQRQHRTDDNLHLNHWRPCEVLLGPAVGLLPDLRRWPRAIPEYWSNMNMVNIAPGAIPEYREYIFPLCQLTRQIWKTVWDQEIENDNLQRLMSGLVQSSTGPPSLAS